MYCATNPYSSSIHQYTFTVSTKPKSTMKVFQSLLLVSLLPVVAQSQGIIGCGDSELAAYTQCVLDNPCLCSNCDSNPMDKDPIIRLDQPPESCQDIHRIFCPFIRCCSACEDVAKAWYSCAFEDFSEGILGSECSQECTVFEFADVEGDCSTHAPTSAVESAATFAPTSDIDDTNAVTASASTSGTRPATGGDTISTFVGAAVAVAIIILI